MLNYKKVKIPKKNLPPEISSSEFKAVWISVLSNKNSDLTRYMEVLEPFVDFIIESISLRNEPNFFLLSLLSLINYSPNVALAKLKLWKESSDIKEEILETIVDRARSLNKIPHKAKPLMAEYFFVLDIKYSLSKKIKKIKIQNKQSINTNSFYIDHHSDLETGNPWYDYLLKLYVMGYNTTEISRITKLSRKTIIQEGEKLWECLKQKL